MPSLVQCVNSMLGVLDARRAGGLLWGQGLCKGVGLRAVGAWGPVWAVHRGAPACVRMNTAAATALSFPAAVIVGVRPMVVGVAGVVRWIVLAGLLGTTVHMCNKDPVVVVVCPKSGILLPFSSSVAW